MSELVPVLLWTPLPLELVVEGMTEGPPACVVALVAGRRVEVIPRGNGTGVVQRLISTDPQDYLDPRWQPGVLVSLLGGGGLGQGG